MISVNGQRRQDNNFTVDGVDNNFMMMNSPGMSPPMDAIQEFRVLDNTSAEFGRSSGSNVNIVEEMVNLIVAQRAYEINSKSIQTSDEMLQNIAQMKR